MKKILAGVQGLAILVLAFAVPEKSGVCKTNLQMIYPSANPDFTLLEDGNLGSLLDQPAQFARSWIFEAQYRFQNDPLVLWDASLTQKTPLVAELHSVSLGAGFLVSDRLLVGVGSFFAASTLGMGGAAFGVGDARIFAKYSLRENPEGLSISLVPELYLPTGNGNLYLSNSSLAPGLGIAADFGTPYVRIAADAGIEYFANAYGPGLDTRLQLPFGIGASARVGRRLAANLEARSVAIWPQGQGLQKGDDELYLGFSYFPSRATSFSFGATAGNFQPDGTASVGAVAGMRFVPLLKDPPDEGAAARESCGERPFTAKFFARRLTAGEQARKWVLPYMSTPEHPSRRMRHRIPVLQLGQMTGLAQGGIPYVYASQVIFAIDVDGLPPLRSIVGVDMISLRMSLRKVSRGNYLDTEILCFLDQRVCSGELYRDKDWLDNLNQEFLGGKETPNDFFTRQYLAQEVGRVKEGRIYASEVVLPLAKLLENSGYPDPLGLIYEGADPGRPLEKRALYLLVAGDTYVSSDAALEMVLRENTCIK